MGMPDPGPEPVAPQGRGHLSVGFSAAACLAGIVASALLLVDYVRPAAVFCGGGGGCERLRSTTYAAVLGVPTPAFGLLGFCAVAVALCFSGPRARLVQLALAALGAVVATFLLAVQLRLSVFCRYCLVADIGCLVLLVGSVFRYRLGVDATFRFAVPTLGGSFVLAAAIPMGVGFTRPLPPPEAQGPVPELVKREIASAPPGVVTVIDFVDFECPFCRMTHEGFAPVLERHKGRVRVIRKQVPLTRIHPRSMDAALAACCGEKLGKGAEMAEALFSTPPDDLTREGCEKLATKLSLPPAEFRSCFDDPSTRARVDREIAEFKEAGGRGLPTIWIGAERFVGAQDPAHLEAAIRRASGG